LQIKLPGLAKLREDNVQPGFDMIPNVCKKYGLVAVAASDDNTMFNISNTKKLGISEVSLVQLMIDGIGKLIQVEKAVIAGIDIGIIESTYEVKAQTNDVDILVINVRGEIPDLEGDKKQPKQQETITNAKGEIPDPKGEKEQPEQEEVIANGVAELIQAFRLNGGYARNIRRGATRAKGSNCK